MFGQVETGFAVIKDPFTSHATSSRLAESNGRAGAHDWQTKAIAEYDERAQTRLREQLIRRVLALTGHVVRAQAIGVNAISHSAVATVDGVLFCLSGGKLMVVRSCAHCETGRFESPPIMSLIDLGYALAIWQPYHQECEPTDSGDVASW